MSERPSYSKDFDLLTMTMIRLPGGLLSCQIGFGDAAIQVQCGHWTNNPSNNEKTGLKYAGAGVEDRPADGLAGLPHLSVDDQGKCHFVQKSISKLVTMSHNALINTYFHSGHSGGWVAKGTLPRHGGR